MSPWYKEAFGRLYPLVYSHRDEEEARAISRLLASRRPLEGRRILDLACGEGRMARVLAHMGARVLGCDLSWQLLALAGRQHPAFPRLRADMRRLPVTSRVMDGVLSVFTSFGYFAEERQDLEVLDEVQRVLGPGGFFFLDLSQPLWVRRNLVPRSHRRVRGWEISEERHLEEGGSRVVKTVHAVNGPGGRRESWQESVRLYERERMEEELGKRRFRLLGVWGDYDGCAPAPEAPRLIFLAELG